MFLKYSPTLFAIQGGDPYKMITSNRVNVKFNYPLSFYMGHLE